MCDSTPAREVGVSGFDAEYLKRVQYRDSQNLDSRISLHDRYSIATVPWQEWVFGHFEFPSGARVLEVGCGSGRLWVDNAARISASWSLTLTDFSPGMVEAAREAVADLPCDVDAEVADVCDLPYPEGHFDAVVANHMLYHLEERALALSEIRRVLRQDGRMYAATNGTGHLRELYEVIRRIEPGAPARSERAVAFGAQNATAQLAPFFRSTAMFEYPDALQVTDAAAIVEYVRSAGAWRNTPYAVLRRLREDVEDEIRARGHFHITKESVLFVCSGSDSLEAQPRP